MSASLTPLTQSPVVTSSFPIAPDEGIFGMSSLLRTIAIWDADAKDDVFKTNFVFFVKKAFAFLDRCGIGSCFYSEGFTGMIRAYADRLSTHRQSNTNLLERTRSAREEIVNALGGERMCRTYPVVNLKPEDCGQHLKLNDQYFSQGQHIVQGEDPNGRKFAVLRLHDSSNSLLIATVHQLFHETDNNGSLWIANFSQPSRRMIIGTDSVVNFINDEINLLGHGRPLPLSFVLKP